MRTDKAREGIAIGHYWREHHRFRDAFADCFGRGHSLTDSLALQRWLSGASLQGFDLGNSIFDSIEDEQGGGLPRLIFTDGLQ